MHGDWCSHDILLRVPENAGPPKISTDIYGAIQKSILHKSSLVYNLIATSLAKKNRNDFCKIVFQDMSSNINLHTEQFLQYFCGAVA